MDLPAPRPLVLPECTPAPPQFTAGKWLLGMEKIRHTGQQEPSKEENATLGIELFCQKRIFSYEGENETSPISMLDYNTGAELLV